MRKALARTMVALAIAGIATTVSAQGRRFDPPAARIASQPGGTLTPPSGAAPVAILGAYLRQQGRDAATAQSIVEIARASARGTTQARYEQRVAGLPVHGTYARAAFSSRGELLHLIENFVPAGAVARAQISAAQAVNIAVRNLYPELRTVPPGFFRRAPAATAVAIPQPDGTLTAGFRVETWTRAGNQLHETLVDRDGTILEVESRTNNDSYNVFRISPAAGAQQVVFGPGTGSAQSPGGWLFSGAQGSTNIRGNNVAAYLDAVSDNKSDANGTAVTDGNFLSAADLDASPTTQTNRNVAIQNLFYLNNLIHDELWTRGFTEAAGNFQENNFGLGGRGSDSVNAEAQDGGGTDNANFATPRDGQNPRMQMYLWNGKGTHQVVVGSSTFPAQGAEFGPALDAAGITGSIVLVNDGTGTTSDACEALAAGSLSGKIALVDRGSCNFTAKAANAQAAGATAVIVANNANGDSIITMCCADPAISIPAVFVSQNSGVTLKAMVPVSGTVRLTDPAPLMRDGDVDSDIVFHEYCHGLTWRMIGRMSGALAGAIGEGMSDICALLMNGDDAVGEYSFSDPLGIRRFRYDGYPLSYADVTGAEVHDDGEIYAAIGWRLIELFGETRVGDLFTYLVDGMNYTPAGPTYEQMRDGILQSVAINPLAGGDDCRVWQAFAEFGVGVGARGSARGSSVKITESFVMPAGCPVP